MLKQFHIAETVRLKRLIYCIVMPNYTNVYFIQVLSAKDTFFCPTFSPIPMCVLTFFCLTYILSHLCCLPFFVSLFLSPLSLPPLTFFCLTNFCQLFCLTFSASPFSVSLMSVTFLSHLCLSHPFFLISPISGSPLSCVKFPILPILSHLVCLTPSVSILLYHLFPSHFISVNPAVNIITSINIPVIPPSCQTLSLVIC